MTDNHIEAMRLADEALADLALIVNQEIGHARAIQAARVKDAINRLRDLASSTRGDEAKGEVVAWMHPEDGRVIPAATMNGARKDGGAMLSSLRGHTVPLVRATPSTPIGHRQFPAGPDRFTQNQCAITAKNEQP